MATIQEGYGSVQISAPGKEPYTVFLKVRKYIWDGNETVESWPAACKTKLGTPVGCDVILHVYDPRTQSFSADFTAEHKADLAAWYESQYSFLSASNRIGLPSAKYDCFAYAVQRYNVRLHWLAFVQFGFDGHFSPSSNPTVPAHTNLATHGTGFIWFLGAVHATWNVAMIDFYGFMLPSFLGKHGLNAIYITHNGQVEQAYSVHVSQTRFFDKN